MSIHSEDTEPVHSWFELSYAQYLTIPRSVLQSMPAEWQRRFVRCLEELDGAIDWRPKDGRYWVKLKDGRGRCVEDPLMDYERGRRRLPLTGLCRCGCLWAEHKEPETKISWDVCSFPCGICDCQEFDPEGVSPCNDSA